MGTATLIQSAVIFSFRSKYMSGIFEQTPANRRRYGVAILLVLLQV